MKAVILAAGSGARLRPLTNHEHKTMVCVAGERIIDRIIDSLIFAQVDRVCVVLGHQADRLREHLEKTYCGRIEFTFVLNPRYLKTNNIYSLSLALECVDEDFLLIECDLFYDVDIVRDLVNLPAQDVAVVARYQTGMDGTVVSVGADALVSDFHPTQVQDAAFDFSDKFKTLNIYKFSARFLREKLRQMISFYTKIHSENCYYEVVLGVMIYLRSQPISAFDVTGRNWMEIDTVNDLEKANYLFAPERRYAILSNMHGGYWNHEVIDFCYIRNMHFPSASLLGDLRYNFDKLAFNYGSCQKVLNQKLANFLLIPAAHCCLLNGASQGIKLLPALLKTERIATFTPTFDEYLHVFAQPLVMTAEVTGLHELAQFAVDQGVQWLLLTNPNNPTGRYYPVAEIISFLQTAGSMGLSVILDESFIEFAGDGCQSVAAWLTAQDVQHVLLVKSLSKSLGVPGIRLGYIQSANSHWMAQLNAMLPIWNANSVAQYLLELLPKYRLELAQSFARTRDERDQFFSQLCRIEQLESFESGGNYVLCRLRTHDLTANQLANILMRDWGVLIKDCSSKFPENGDQYIRLAVRTAQENQNFLEILSRVFAQVQAGTTPERI